MSAGAGTKGPRLHDWCYLELADLEAEDFNDENHGLWTRGLLIRRNIADGDSMPLSDFIHDALYEISLGVQLARARARDLVAIMPAVIDGRLP